MAIFLVNLGYPVLLKLRMTEVAVTTGATRRAKLQSNCHYQQTNIQHLSGQMPFLSPIRVKALNGSVSLSLTSLFRGHHRLAGHDEVKRKHRKTFGTAGERRSQARFCSVTQLKVQRHSMFCIRFNGSFYELAIN